MKLFRKGAPSPSGTIDVVGKPMQMADLERTMNEISAAVEPWDGTRILLVKPLQEAARNHGQVCLMKDTANGGLLMAVKRMPNRWVRLGPGDFNDHYPTASEKPWQDIGFIKYLASIDYPYVCKLHGVFRGDEETFVSTSFCPQGDLFSWCDHLSVPKPGQAREATMLPILTQIFTAVRWLHDVGIAHRDLSLENILLNCEGPSAKVHIIDFGMATLQRLVANEVRGKSSYQSPEIFSGAEIDTFLSDEFALGVVMFAMAAQDYPWTCTKRGTCQLFEYVSAFGLRRFLEKRRLRKGHGEFLSEVFTPNFVDVLEALLHFQPKARACFGEGVYAEDLRKKKRKNVYDFKLLQGALTVKE